VINAIQDFTDFDADIYNATMKSGPECTQTIQEITASIDAAFEAGNSDDLEKLFTTFENTNPEITQGDFMFMIADIFTAAVQYGERTTLCALITSDSFKEDIWGNLAKYGKS
jgi:hypothetical protein